MLYTCYRCNALQQCQQTDFKYDKCRAITHFSHCKCYWMRRVFLKTTAGMSGKKSGLSIALPGRISSTDYAKSILSNKVWCCYCKPSKQQWHWTVEKEFHHTILCLLLLYNILCVDMQEIIQRSFCVLLRELCKCQSFLFF